MILLSDFYILMNIFSFDIDNFNENYDNDIINSLPCYLLN
jgi:hypothetical protein